MRGAKEGSERASREGQRVGFRDGGRDAQLSQGIAERSFTYKYQTSVRFCACDALMKFWHAISGLRDRSYVILSLICLSDDYSFICSFPACFHSDDNDGLSANRCTSQRISLKRRQSQASRPGHGFRKPGSHNRSTLFPRGSAKRPPLLRKGPKEGPRRAQGGPAGGARRRPPGRPPRRPPKRGRRRPPKRGSERAQSQTAVMYA